MIAKRNALIYFKVILQDAVMLMDSFPQHYLWRHQIFKSNEFQQYATELKSHISIGKTPAHLSLVAAIPELTNVLQNNHQHIVGLMNGIQEGVTGVMTYFTDFVSGKAPLQMNCTFSIPNSTSLMIPDQNPQPQTDPVPFATIPNYVMSRSTKLTVRDLWREWDVGLVGLPAVRDLEAKWKRKWRSSNTESKFFLRRKVIIDYISVKSERIGIERALNELEQIQYRRKISLDGIRKLIENNEI